MLGPGPGVVYDDSEEQRFHDAAQDEVVPLAHGATDDSQGVDSGCRHVHDSAEVSAHDEGQVHHEAGDDDVEGDTEEEGLVDGEHGQLLALQVGPYIGTVSPI